MFILSSIWKKNKICKQKKQKNKNKKQSFIKSF